MLAGCIGVPILLLFLFGNGASLGGNWLLFGILVLCIGSHIAMMFGKHGGRSSAATDGAEKRTDEDKEPSAKDEQAHKGGCH